MEKTEGEARPAMTESKQVDVLGALDAAAVSFDNIRFERRGDPNAERLDVYWSTRIDEVMEARAAVAELIDAAREIVSHARGCEILLKVDEQPTTQRLRAALAACTPAKSEGR